ILDARRRALSAPAVRPARSDLLGVSEAPPPLYIPPVPRAVTVIPVGPPPATLAPAAPAARPGPVPAPAPVPMLPPPSYGPPPAPPAPPRTSSGAILVVDASQPQSSADRTAPAGETGRASPLATTTARSRAGSMSNR